MRQDAKLDRLAAIPLFADTERRHLQRIAQIVQGPQADSAD